MPKQRKTSKRVATIAAKILRDPKYGKKVKIPAGSALGQRAPKRK